MNKIVESFVNYSFTIGEWLIVQKALNREMIEDMGHDVILGIPALCVLHCIEKTSNFEDGCIHLATNHKINPETPHLTIGIQHFMKQMLQGATVYRKIPFTYETYRQFKIKVIKSYHIDTNVEWEESKLELKNIITAIALGITQIQEYKEKYGDVLKLLKEMCD